MAVYTINYVPTGFVGSSGSLNFINDDDVFNASSTRISSGAFASTATRWSLQNPANTNATGLILVLNGTGFTYDASGRANGGTITSIGLYQASDTTLSNPVATITGLTNNSAATFATNLFGAGGGKNPAYGYIFAGDDTINVNGGAQVDATKGNDTVNVASTGGYVRLGPGNDAINYAGGGFLTLAYDDTYSTTPLVTGLNINLNTKSVTDPWGGTDTWTGTVNRLVGTQIADSMTADGSGVEFRGLGGADTFTGGSGYDIVDYSRDANYSGGTGAVTVNLGTGTATDGFGATDKFTSIEEVIGTSGGDSLTSSNTPLGILGKLYNLYGEAGNDTLAGGTQGTYFRPGSGNDVIAGGSATNDRLSYSDYTGSNGLVINMGSGTVLDPWGGTDTFSGIEGIEGTMNADSIVGGATTTQIIGGAGNDTLDGGAGAANVILRYDRDGNSGGNGAVNVNLRTGVAIDGFGNTDKLFNIHKVRGTDTGNDVFVGDDFGDTFQGLGGNTTISGGLGMDFLDYSFDATVAAQDGLTASGVVVNLAKGTATNGLGGTDTFTSIEGVIGTSSGDNVIGNLSANMLSTDGAQDTVQGGDDLALSDAQKTIVRLYGATLNRQPDVAGLNGWVGFMNGGMSLDSIAQGFVNSAEFQAAYGALDNTGFVTLLYNNVLKRAPDSGGLNGWLALMNGGLSRSGVVTGFSNSDEYKGNTDAQTGAFATSQLDAAFFGQVFRLYGATLNRQPDSAGFGGWVDILAGGQTLSGIASGFINSAEFQSAYGGKNNSDFVTLLYNNVLKRGPDSGGLNGWLALMAGGMSRQDVVTGFSESDEYKNNTAAPLRTFMQTVMTNWADTLNGGAGDDVLFGGRGADVFQFDKSAVGSDTIYGFESWDILNLTGFGYANSAAAASHMTQSGADTVFADQGETITFKNTTLATVTGATMTFV